MREYFWHTFPTLGFIEYKFTDDELVPIKTEIDKIQKEITKQNLRSTNARGLMLDGEITATEYKEIKIEIETSITNSTRELNKLSNTLLNIESKIDGCIELLSNIENIYKKKRYSNKYTYNWFDISSEDGISEKFSSNPRNESGGFSYTQR